MKCPKCNQEMSCKDKGSYGRDWEDGSPYWIPHEVYTCNHCHIKKDGREWLLPSNLLPATDKQIACVRFIQSQLDFDELFEPVLKSQCWKFIHHYLDEAKTAAMQSQDYEEYYEEHF